MNKFWALAFVVLSIPTYAQEICTGNLGENIFSIGDFGSGEDNILQTNPEIAPGYNYTTIVPPSDGFYIITNDMRAPQWNNLFGTWIKIPDNSDDPLGYMMVVNASFEPGIFYEEEVTGLCENTLYEFSADVINLIRIGVTGHHEPNLSFLLDDEVQYSSGIIPQDETWHKHGFTFTTGPDQTSLRLTLRNNAPGGIGNDLALDNISFRPCGPSAFAEATEDILVCSNDNDPIEIIAETADGAAIQWQRFSEITSMWENVEGETSTSIFHLNYEPGEYLYRYLTAGSSLNLENDKCSVISDQARVTVLPIEFTVYDTICENVIYEFGSQRLDAEGFYEETLIASSGCDSFVDLFLTHVADPNLEMEFEIGDPLCFGDSTGFIEVTGVDNAVDPYEIFVDGVGTGTTIPSLPGGTYSLRAEDRYSCFSEEEVFIVDPEEFFVDLGPDTIIEFGAILNFAIESNFSVANGSWTGSQLECEQCVVNSAQPFESGIYVFRAINEDRCNAIDSITVTVRTAEELLYKPNIFSPNEDGFNDQFIILSGSQAIQDVKLFSVFDRFGNLMYSTRNRNFQNQDYGWDGTANGTPAEEGIYTYVYQFTLINNDEIAGSGEVALIR